MRALIWLAFLANAYITYRMFEISHDLAIGYAAAWLLVVFIAGNRHRRL